MSNLQRDVYVVKHVCGNISVRYLMHEEDSLTSLCRSAFVLVVNRSGGSEQGSNYMNVIRTFFELAIDFKQATIFKL